MASKVVLKLDQVIQKFNSLPDKISSGVKIVGPAAAYALVWELGAIHLSKPGPKTVWSTNADGETVILTIQAPHGYIKINRQKYAEIIQDEIAHADFSGNDFSAVMTKVMDKAIERIVQVIALAAPVDTGLLKSSIQPITTSSE